MSTALNTTNVSDWSGLAIKATQIQDPSGNAIDVADIVGGSGNKFVAAGSTLTLTMATGRGKTVLLDTAAGSTVTLPAATGSGATIRFLVKVLATSNSHVIACAGSDKFQGIVFTGDDTSANAQWFAAVAGTSATMTLNRTTTGSVTVGEWIDVEDVATNRWQVKGFITNTGTAATPFS